MTKIQARQAAYVTAMQLVAAEAREMRQLWEAAGMEAAGARLDLALAGLDALRGITDFPDTIGDGGKKSQRLLVALRRVTGFARQIRRLMQKPPAGEDWNRRFSEKLDLLDGSFELLDRAAGA